MANLIKVAPNTYQLIQSIKGSPPPPKGNGPIDNWIIHNMGKIAQNISFSLPNSDTQPNLVGNNNVANNLMGFKVTSTANYPACVINMQFFDE